MVYERLGMATPFRYRVFPAALEFLDPMNKAIVNGEEFSCDGRAMGSKQRFSRGNFFFYWQEYQDDYFDEEGAENAAIPQRKDHICL